MAERTTETSWFVSRLFHYGKIAGALLACSVILNSVAGFFNIRAVGSKEAIAQVQVELARTDTVIIGRVAVNSASIGALRSQQDSIVKLLTKIENKLAIQCYLVVGAQNRDICHGVIK